MTNHVMGTTSAMTKIPDATHAARQPKASMSCWWTMTKVIPPMPNPAVTKEVARPRWRTNHFCTGTEVSRLPGMVMPLRPTRTNRARNCQAFCTHPRPMRAMPANPAAAVMSARLP